MNSSPSQVTSAKTTAKSQPPHSPVAKEKRTVPAAVVALIVIALGFGFWNLWRRVAPEIIASASPEEAYVASFPEKTIAVLPFSDLSDSKDDRVLADGVQDDIQTALSKVADLRVISRTSVNGYAPDSNRNLREIAQSLGAAYILEGSVTRIGERVSITTQLSDARREIRLWNQSYEREMSQLFGMQSELVMRIASQMQATVSPKEKAAMEERPTQDLVAYGLYIRGKALLDTISVSGQINEKVRQAAQLLEQSVARDPDFFLAYCQLAAAHGYLYFFGLDHSPARLAQADAALKTIRRLRPDAGETHFAQANFYYRCFLDYDHARAELGIAQQNLPNNSEIFELTGYIDRRQGRWNESARSLQRALELDPRNSFILQQIALSYQEFRQFGAMAAAFDRALLLIPHDLDTRVTRATVDLEWRADVQPVHQIIHAILAEDPSSAPDLAAEWFRLGLCERDPATAKQALAAMPASGTSADLNFPRSFCEGLAARARGDISAAQNSFRAARAELEQTLRDQPNYAPAHCVMGLIHAALGEKDAAIQEGQLAIKMLPVTKDAIDGSELVKYLSVIYAWVGEKDLAIHQINAALRIPSTLSYGMLKLHPYFDSLRGDPRFEEIVAGLAPKDNAR